jgi:hypothetical protein
MQLNILIVVSAANRYKHTQYDSVIVRCREMFLVKTLVTFADRRLPLLIAMTDGVHDPCSDFGSKYGT